MKPILEIHPDVRGACEAMAMHFADASRAAVSDHGRFAVALAGGHTPKEAYEDLGNPPLSDEVPWARVHVFWGDERCVSEDDPRSNIRMAREAFIDEAVLPDANIHPIECAGDPDGGARAYEASLRAFFGEVPKFDLVILGLGDNGHTASLWPGTPVVDETERWVAPVYVKEQDLWRVTLTFPVLDAAHEVVFLVTGEEKADAVASVIDGPRNPERLPAQRVSPASGRLRFILDEAAAARLKR